MTTKYHIDCDKCKGTGKIEVALELYLNKTITQKFLAQISKQPGGTKQKVYAAIDLKDESKLDQHMFSLIEIYKLAELLNCKPSDLLP